MLRERRRDPYFTGPNRTFADDPKVPTGNVLSQNSSRATLPKRARFLKPGGRMRRVLGVVCGLIALACSEQAPSSPEPFISLASILGEGASANNSAAPIVMATQMRNELESPACPSESKGHAEIKVDQAGTIHSHVTLNNKGAESVRFGHIHHLNTGAATGPIIWWLSSPIGTDLNLTDRHLTFAQAGAFVTQNPSHFATHEAALARLLTNPEEFYVNFHSDRCPGGFARGFLP